MGECSREVIIIAKFNEVMLGTQLFQSIISTDVKMIGKPQRDYRIRLLGLYNYLYERPDLIVKVFKMDPGTLYCDTFNASNCLVDLVGELLSNHRTPAEAVKEYLKRRK